MKLTNEEIARVFAMYCPNVEVRYFNDFQGKIKTEKLVGVINDSVHQFLTIDKENDGLRNSEYFKNASALMLLYPLAKISDEHAIEIYKVIHKDKDLTDDEIVQSMKGWIRAGFNGGWITWDVYQQLILWGYAVPLYFGVNHPANGLTAIELEIAIDKTLLTLPVS